MMKRIIIFLLLLVTIFPIMTVEAETIQGFRNKIAELEKEKEEGDQKRAEIQAQIEEAEEKIRKITLEVVSIEKEKENTKKEIQELQKEIKVKDKEIKELMTFYQVSENDNFYLKFVFGAESFEDFIYRFSVAEQLTDANDRLMDEMNTLIKKNEKKIKEYEKKQKELDVLNAQTEVEMKKLGKKKKAFDEESLSIDEEIATVEKQIKTYEKMGCGENQDLGACIAAKNSSSGGNSSPFKPNAKGFVLPLSYGEVSSYYGWRTCPFHGYEFHSGTDISAASGTTIMASKAGLVVLATYYQGFGNCVMIYHSDANVTTLYGHMSVISVSDGQYVSTGQKIGEVGSTGNSTGPHLHFQAMYGSGYGTTFNPSDLVYIPYSW